MWAAEIVSDVSKGKCVSQCHEGPLQWELTTYLPSTHLLISPEDVSPAHDTSLSLSCLCSLST